MKNDSRLKRGRLVVRSPWWIVPPHQPFSTRIGCIRSAIDFRKFAPIAAAFLLNLLSPVSLTKGVHLESYCLGERRIRTDQTIGLAIDLPNQVASRKVQGRWIDDVFVERPWAAPSNHGVVKIVMNSSSPKA